MVCNDRRDQAGLWRALVGMLFARFARKVIQTGRLTIVDADGRRHVVGNSDWPAATIRLHDKSLHHRLALNPYLYIGEAYMDGSLTIEQGNLYDFVNICAVNCDTAFEQPLTAHAMWSQGGCAVCTSTIRCARARANVAHHYDLSQRALRTFLDEDMQYSCAYFTRPDMTLEEAQAAKQRAHRRQAAARGPGQRVLDIGCGWGGLALEIAREPGPRCSASPCPRSSSMAPGSAPRARAWRTSSSSAWSTTAT